LATEDELTFEDELYRLIEARPFEPFQLSLASGEKLVIASADYVVIGAQVVSVIGETAGAWVIRKNQLVAASMVTTTK
jgi:hypothetical protein